MCKASFPYGQMLVADNVNEGLGGKGLTVTVTAEDVVAVPQEGVAVLLT